MQKTTGRKLVINRETMNIVVQYMEQLANTTFDYKYYMTADNHVMRRADFYHEIQSAGFTLDVRKFKGKRAHCPNKLCNMSKTGFDMQVQAEVDVAIVMKAMEHLY